MLFIKNCETLSISVGSIRKEGNESFEMDSYCNILIAYNRVDFNQDIE
jgi:hypothetical protein